MALFGKLYLSAVAGVLLVSAIIFAYNRIKFYLNSVKTTGRIIAIEGRPSLRKTYYYPLIEYTDEDGASVTFVDGIGSSTPHDGCVGRKVTVRYQPGAKEREAQLWTIPSLTLAPASFLLLAGGCLLAIFHAR